MEVLYHTDHLPSNLGYQPFTLSTGDPTGFGLHASFINGWDSNVLTNAISNSNCDETHGGNAENCPPLSGSIKHMDPGQCSLAQKIPLTEDLAIGHTSLRLAGCNPISNGPQDSTPCYSPPDEGYDPGLNIRFHLRSKKTGKYLTCPQNHALPLTAAETVLSLAEVFTLTQYMGGVTIQEEVSLSYWSPNGGNQDGTDMSILCDRGEARDWEIFFMVPQSGNFVAFKSNRNTQYLSIQANGHVAPTANSIGDGELFERIPPTGGSVY